MIGVLSAAWKWIANVFRPNRRIRVHRNLHQFCPERANSYLKKVVDFIESDLFKETPFTILVVPLAKDREFLVRELNDMGWKTTEVAMREGYNLSVQTMSTNSDGAHFYVICTSLATVGWYTGIHGAAMMCFSTVGWDRFLQLKERCRNNGTFYANGKFHKILGVSVNSN